MYNREGEERGREEDESGGVNTRQVHIEQLHEIWGKRGEGESKRKGRGRRKG